MSPPNSTRTPLARLVLFMICLSIAGSAVAGAHYYAIDLPAQVAALHPPANSESCTIIHSGGCTHILNTICYVSGSGPEVYKACMKDFGCCA